MPLWTAWAARGRMTTMLSPRLGLNMFLPTLTNPPHCQVRRFQCLVSLMLSSQTKDEVNFAAMLRLREHRGEHHQDRGGETGAAHLPCRVLAHIGQVHQGRVSGADGQVWWGYPGERQGIVQAEGSGAQDGAPGHECRLGGAGGDRCGLACAQDLC